MILENGQTDNLKTIATAIAVGTSIIIYLLYRRQLLTKYPTFERFIRVAWSIFFHWSQLIKNMFSLSLSTSEQSIFEEEFKYLIVTSSLFNETQQQPQQLKLDDRKNDTPQQKDIRDEEEFFVNSNRSLTICVLGVSTLSVIISILILTKFNSVSPLLLPCWISAYFATCYFLYKHHRHVQIRRIHASALDSMQKIVTLSQESDSILIRLLNSFHDSSSKTAENDLADQQQTFGTYLCNHFEMYTELVHLLQPLIDTDNLSTLREMYNVKEEIPSSLLEFDSNQYKMDDIDLIYSVTNWKRREYLLYLLALDVMSNNRKNTHYGKNWRQAIKVNIALVDDYKLFNKKLSVLENLIVDKKAERIVEQQQNDILVTSSFSSSLLMSLSPKEGSSSTFTLSDKRSLSLIHRVSAVEKYMEDIQAKLFLCKQDTKSLSSGRVSTLSLERMSKRFNTIDESFVNLLTQWEESKNALNKLLEDEQSKLGIITLLPSPPSSPRNLKSFNDDLNSISSGIMSNSSESVHLKRSRSYGGDSRSFRAHRSSLTKNRLQRIQSLKTNNRIVMDSLSPINTTTATNNNSQIHT